MKKVNQHYVPQFYQKLFSSSGKSIGKYIIDPKKYISHSSIKNTASKKYYYGETETIEDILMRIEAQASLIIKNIIKNRKVPELNSNEYEMLLLFVLTLEARVLKVGDYQSNQAEILIKTMLQMRKDNGDPDLQEINLDNFKIETSSPTTNYIRAAASNLAIVRDLNCTLIVSNTYRDFITSDNPVVRYNYMYNDRQYLKNYGLANMGLQIFLPISPKLCLYIYDDVMYNKKTSCDGNFYVRKASDLDKLNLLFFMNSYNFLLFNNRIKEEYIIKLINGHSNLKAEKNEPTVVGSNNNKLIIQEFKCVKNKIFLPFFRINRKLINMPLIPNMQGPLRPCAKHFIDMESDNSK